MADVFDKFKEYSVAEFFKKNRQMLGFSGKTRSLTTIVHEYLTNSLDACEEHGILPDIHVELKELESGNVKVRVQDNGIGIPEKFIGKALGQMLSGTKFARYAQQRGQQGIGAAGCTMYALLTTGKPVYVESRYAGASVKCNLAIDFKSNAPVMNNVVKEESANSTGLIVEGEFADVKYDTGPYGVYEYLKRTALANPHSQITLVEPNGNSILFPRSDDRVPAKPKDILPHPLGITAHDLIDFAKRDKGTDGMAVFLQESFSRVSPGKIAELKALLPDINFARKPKDLNWEDAEKMVKAFKQLKWISPATESVVPIGREQIEKAMKSILVPDFISVTERSPKVFRGGIPFLVEAAIAYGGSAGRAKAEGGRSGDIMRFANRVPLLFDAGGCGITESVKNIDWKRYGIRNFDESPVTVLINFTSVHVPYTGAGKQAISQDEEIIDEIKNAVQEAARVMQRYVNSVVREKEKQGKKKAVLRYIFQLSSDLSELSGSAYNKADLEKMLTTIVESKYLGEEALANGNGEAESSESPAKDENGNGKKEKEGNGEAEKEEQPE